MDNIFTNNTEVLIFYGNDDVNPIGVGKIIDSELSSDLSKCSNKTLYKWIYRVEKSDGTIMRGTYNKPYVNYIFFKTREDHITYLKYLISERKEEMRLLGEEISHYLEVLSNVEEKTKNLKKE